MAVVAMAEVVREVAEKAEVEKAAEEMAEEEMEAEGTVVEAAAAEDWEEVGLEEVGMAAVVTAVAAKWRATAWSKMCASIFRRRTASHPAGSGSLLPAYSSRTAAPSWTTTSRSNQR